MNEIETARYAPKLAAVAAVVLVIAAYAAIAPPGNFPTGSIITVSRGDSVAAVAEELASAHAASHPTLFRFLVRMFGGRIQAGPYLMKEPQTALTVAYRLATGQFDIPPVRVTFPEGFTVADMAEKLSEAMPQISRSAFIASGTPMEGYLFPDTYLFGPDATLVSVQKTMRDTFDEKILPLSLEIRASGHSISDIVVMASLVEKEARTRENRKLVAGVLWNRLTAGMPLQTDAVFGYIFGRDTYSPTLDDLKVDSPYNDYTHKGLPPGPINNPGLDALMAALYPTKSKYLYYLTDKEGVMHYAVTFAEHEANIAKYPH